MLQHTYSELSTQGLRGGTFHETGELLSGVSCRRFSIAVAIARQQAPPNWEVSHMPSNRSTADNRTEKLHAEIYEFNNGNKLGLYLSMRIHFHHLPRTVTHPHSTHTSVRV